jgi:transcriptional regulator with XRE-family HTH domain
MRKKQHATPLENLRRARTITQANFARLIGVSQQNYSKYESGVITPSVDMQARIAAILGVSRAELWPVIDTDTDEPKAARA